MVDTSSPTKLFRHIQLSGAGGVGKTMLTREFVKDGWVLFPSVTRSWYALNEISDEAELKTKSKAFRRDFQFGIYEFFKQKYEEFVLDQRMVNTISERTLFDNLAYLIMHCVDDLRVDELRGLLKDSIDWTLYKGFVTDIFFIPYPQPYMQDDSMPIDGFRDIKPGKDYTVSSIMYQLIFAEWSTHSKLRKTIIPRGKRTPAETKIFIEHCLAGKQLAI